MPSLLLPLRRVPSLALAALVIPLFIIAWGIVASADRFGAWWKGEKEDGLDEA